MKAFVYFLLAINFAVTGFSADQRECVKYLKNKEGKLLEEVKSTDDSNADACLKAHEACLKKKENLLRSKVYPADPGLFCSFEK